MYHHLYPALAHQRAASLRRAADATRLDHRRHPAIEPQPPRTPALNRLHRLITKTP
jgi:hypothetical protein